MKKIISYVILALFLVVALTPTTYAEDGAADTGISLDKAVEMALKKSNAIKQIDYDIERSEEVRKSAADKVIFEPMGPGHDPQAVAAFTGLVAIDMGLQMTKKGKELEKDKITLNVFNKYTDVLSAQESFDTAQAELAKAKSDWQITLLSYDSGVISKSQLKFAEAGHKVSNVSYELAQKELDKAYQDFNLLVGLKVQDRPVLTEEITYNPLEVTDLDHTVVRIMDGNPAIWLADEQVKFKELQLDLYSWNDPTREPYKAKKIDIEKAELSAADRKKQMREGLYTMYQSIIQLEDRYVMAEQNLKVKNEEYGLKNAQYDVGMISKQDYLAAGFALAKAENDLNQLVYKHAALVKTFYKPWAFQMDTK